MIKKINPDAVYKIVVMQDDALLNETPVELAELEKMGEKSRYQKFLETFDLSILKFKEGAKPTYFHIKAVKHSEQLEIVNKYFEFDVNTRKMVNKNRNKMLCEYFDLACLGMENESGVVEKVSSEEIPLEVVLEVGSFVTLAGHLRPEIKKS